MPGGCNRNTTCHTAENASAIITMRFGTFEAEKSSRIASEYARPAITSQAIKEGPPRSLKWREQIVRASSRMPPSASNLGAGARVTTLPCDDALARGLVPTRRTTLQFAELLTA